MDVQFTAKQLNRQAAKAGKDETAEKNKLKKVRLAQYPFLSIFSTLSPKIRQYNSPTRI